MDASSTPQAPARRTGAPGRGEILDSPSYLLGLVVLGIIAWSLVKRPLANAGRADESAPPAAMM